MRRKKPVKEISGILSCNLEKGCRAIINCSDTGPIMTSTVIKIRSRNKKKVKFETRNTIYKLKMQEDKLPKAV